MIIVTKSVFKMCSAHTKTKAVVFVRFLRFEEGFRNAPFLTDYSVDDRPKRRNKVAVF